MKTKINIFIYLLLLNLINFACTDLEHTEDCDVAVDVEVIIEENCLPPCEVNFVDHSTANRTINTILLNPDDGTEAVDMLGTYTHTYEQPGIYDITFTLFTQTCDPVTMSRRIIVGEDPPEAKIETSSMSCRVDTCQIEFSYQPVNADSWFWEFPNDPERYENQTVVVYDFTERPDTFRVYLTAINGTGAVKDSVDIKVEPVTFEITEAVSAESGSLDKVIAVEEQPDGSFSIAVNTTLGTTLAEISRGGLFVENSKEPIELELNEEYPYQEAFYTHKGPDGYLIAGTVYYNLSENNDAYAVGLNSDFSLANAPIPPHYAGADGGEFGYGATHMHDGGYLICGQKSTPGPAGMLFFKLDASFNFDDDDPDSRLVLYQENANNRANDIATLDTEFAVVGRKNNPDEDNALQGCYFRLDKELDPVEGSLIFLDFTPLSITYKDDDNIFLIGGDGSTAIVKKVKANGSEVWTATYNNTVLTKGIITSDGHLALVGYSTSGSNDKPQLIKIHSVSKQTLIEEEFSDAAPGQLYSISQTRDNGFIMGGKRTDVGDFILVRTNRAGKTPE